MDAVSVCPTWIFGEKPIDPKGLKSFANVENSYMKAEGIDLLQILRAIARLALEVDSLFPDIITIIGTYQRGQATISNRQAACLLANMLYCTCE